MSGAWVSRRALFGDSRGGGERSADGFRFRGVGVAGGKVMLDGMVSVWRMGGGAVADDMVALVKQQRVADQLVAV